MVKRTYIPGSKWMYYKIYCGPSFSDILLGEILAPFIRNQIQNHNIISWFFIRYSDPDSHIRLRIKTFSKVEGSLLLARMEGLLMQYFEQGTIWDVQMATYQRELERYGVKNIEICEKIFFAESDLIANLLTERLNAKDMVIITLTIVKKYFTLFFETDEGILDFIKVNHKAFKKEFNILKNEASSINDKYESIKYEFEQFDSGPLSRYKHAIDEHSNKITVYVAHLKQKEIIAGSMVHMLINRVFYKNQRVIELMVYHHLERFYSKKLFSIKT